MRIAEVAVHPADGGAAPRDAAEDVLRADLYLMCANLDETMKALSGKGVRFGEVAMERWGIRTTIVLPSGGRLGLYQPLHTTVI